MTVGLPKSTALKIRNTVETKLKGDYSSEATWKYVNELIHNDKETKHLRTSMIHTLYPDCNAEDMSSKDPRKEYLDQPKIGAFPGYAFPMGFKPLYLPENEAPSFEMHPMMWNVAGEKMFFMFMTFYETLEDSIGVSGKIYDEVQKEIDKTEFEEA